MRLKYRYISFSMYTIWPHGIISSFSFSLVINMSYLHNVLSRTARLSKVLVAAMVKPGHQSGRLCTTLAECGVGSWDALKRDGVLGNRVGDALRVEEVSIMSKVVDVIALLVVASVEGLASLTAEELGLLRGLENFGTGEESSRGDAVLEECGIVGAESEERGDVGKAACLVELLEILLDLVGTSCTREVECAAITVVDTEDIVW